MKLEEYKKQMNKITVLDFEVGKVFQYNIGQDHLCWNPDYERCEQFLSGEGHNLKNINWMVHSNDEIITN